MTIQEHLPTGAPKIQPGVSLRLARNLARKFLAGLVESEMLDADLIIGHCCNLSRLDIITGYDRELTHDECEKTEELLLRRSQGEPIAYLLGEKEFFGLNFYVNGNVLIPRPDTELLVEESIRLLRSLPEPSVIDVCTGSGCVAIAMAHHVKTARIIATDVCGQALKVARMNALRMGVQSQIEFQQGDLLSGASFQQSFDLIVANPPYVKPSDMLTLMRDVRDFEPRLALVGEGEDGLGLHLKILLQSEALLRSGGCLMMEIGAGQAEILSSMHFPGFSSAEFLKDYSGISRVVKYNRLPTEKNKEGNFHG